MSRTYRRKRGDQYTLKWVTRDLVRVSSGYYEWIPLEGDALKKALAKYRSDAGTWSHKEPGPSWWRNIFTERPLRRKAKRELQKYLADQDYEPIIESMGKLEYWT